MIIAQHFVIIISIGVNFVFILLDGIFNDGCSPRFNVVGSRLQIIGGTHLKCTRGSSCSMSTRSTCLVFPVLEYCPWMIMDSRCENSRIFLILREIDVGKRTTSKTCHFRNFKGFEFEFWWICAILHCKYLVRKSKIIASKIVLFAIL